MRDRAPRIAIHAVLLLAAAGYLLPLVVLLLNSLKPLDEIRDGGLLALPRVWTLAAWRAAWSSAQIGVDPTGLAPYFWNSLRMAIPAVAISTMLGAGNGYVLSQWRFRGDGIIFGLLLFSCFIPFQIVLIPAARVLGAIGLAGTTLGLILVHVAYGIGFTTLFFRNYYAAFPTELIRAARIDGAGFFTIFGRILLPNSLPIIAVSVIWQFTNVWNDFLFGASFSDFDSQPMTVALNNLVNSSTGVKEYNVHFAGAILAAAILLCAESAQAQQVELSRLRCRAFIDLPKETIANITLWLDGYYTDEEDPAVVDFDKMKIKAEKLVAFCAQNPKMRVMTAAEEVIVK